MRPQTHMPRTFRLLLFVLSCHAALGTTVIPTDYIQVVPANAANYEVSFSYGQTNAYVTIIMPYTKEQQTFEGAFLECTNSGRRLYVPIKGLRLEGEKDLILISFMMDRELVSECTVKIFFTKGSAKATQYILSVKDFVPKVEVPPNKP